jgi:hypothetical protein
MRVLVSGGQTGADRGGLNAAMGLGIPYRGWCTKSRKAEDGYIPPFYTLQPCNSEDYAVRTELNVIDSEATLIFYYGELTPGSRKTQDLCAKYGRWCNTIDLLSPRPRLVIHVSGCLRAARVVNIAGSRESKAPGIQLHVEEVLREAVRLL